MVDRPKNEVHHWWPRGLSKYWADSEGQAHRLDPNGEFLRSPPKSFGAIRNDNNITFGSTPSPWDESFERAFTKADDAFPWLIEWLQTVSGSIDAMPGPLMRRLTPLAVAPDRLQMLAECLASLIARSPSFRDRISKGSEDARRRFGFPDPKPDKTLVAMGVRNAQQEISRVLRSGGKFALLRAGDQEFIFGDGFLHNFSSRDPPLHPRCLVPLTPNIAVFYTRPRSYRPYPKMLVVNLVQDEVVFINRTVQVYAQRYLFFRSIHPIVEPQFTRHEHLELKHHQHPWIEELQQAMAETDFGLDSLFHTEADAEAP